MPHIRVINKTGKFDYVSGDLLDSLIKLDEITHFYRASEKRWINIKFDPIRGRGGGSVFQDLGDEGSMVGLIVYASRSKADNALD